MWNIVDQFAMFPPSKTSLAQRLLKGGRDVSQPIPVARSAAPTAWFGNQYKAHGIPVPGKTWTLGNGNGLSGYGFGAAAGSGASKGMLVNGVNFMHEWSMDDLLGITERSQLWRKELSFSDYEGGAITYEFLAESLLTAARDAWTRMAEYASQGNSAAVDAIRDFTAKLQKEAREVDATWDNVYAFLRVRPRQYEVRRTTALKNIQRLVNEIIDRERIITKAVVAETAAAKTAAGDDARRGASSMGRQPATGSGTSPTTKAAMAFAGIAAIGAVVYVIRKRTAAKPNESK
jgi:hypothetical protein